MSPVHLRNQPEDREGLSRTRIPGSEHHGHSGGWKNIEGNNTHSAIHLPIQQKPQTRGLKRYGSSSSAPPTPQRSLPMKYGQQEVQHSITLGRAWRKFPEDMSHRDILQRPYVNNQRMESHQEFQTTGGESNQDKGESSLYPSYRRTAEPDRAYSDSFRLTRSRPPQLSSSFQEKTRIQRQKQDIVQPKAERVRTNDPDAVGLGERSTQEPEIVVNNSRISSPNNRNITPTQNDQSVVAPESNLNIDALWVQMPQFAEKNQKTFSEIQESHERMKKLTASMEKIVKTLQEGHAQLSKASEETSKRLNQVFEEQHH
ncbi:hypothetical protein O181_012036 [Austropuccinia psidii MF-1]|uniref:Uncharacterized protein n=1 Tax=Austropuccinia psidii MF-1 TaxID=1389203 RepID=A0A9Q3BTW5_9BASI|nr:hypothetical protein [Austropuccinia psidii MF-1]